MKKILLTLAGFGLCLILICFPMHRPDKETASDSTASPYTLCRQIQYSFTLQNRTDRIIKNAVFRTHAPVKQTPTQLCMHVESSHPYRLITDGLGNQVLQFSFDAIAPHAAKIITIKATLQLSRQPNPFDTDTFHSFLTPEKHIESNHPAVIHRAEGLMAANTLQTAKNIFCWTSGHVRYAGYVSREQGALHAMTHQEGDCTEFMDLFAALCRADHIPVRCIGGYICRQNGILKPGGYHNWAEFYENGTWQIADPQNKTFMQHQSDYIAMRIIKTSSESSVAQFNRFEVEGAGLTVKMNS